MKAGIRCKSWFLLAFLIGACDAGQSEATAKIVFARAVESCICRHLAFEADGYSRIRYEEMVATCNSTVHEANATRFDSTLSANPDISGLRCQDDVADWREAVAEAAVHAQANRDFDPQQSGTRQDVDP